MESTFAKCVTSRDSQLGFWISHLTKQLLRLFVALFIHFIMSTAETFFTQRRIHFPFKNNFDCMLGKYVLDKCCTTYAEYFLWKLSKHYLINELFNYDSSVQLGLQTNEVEKNETQRNRTVKIWFMLSFNVEHNDLL